MSTKVSVKINGFLLTFIAVMALTAGLLVFSFKSMFASISKSLEINIAVTDTELKVDKDQLNNAYDMLNNRKVENLVY